MKTALTWIKDALSSKNLSPLHQHYLVKDGMIYATDGRMTAAHPFPCPYTFCVSGPELERLLLRLPDPITVEPGDNIITFKSGRLRGAIKTMDPAEWLYPTISGDRQPIPTRLPHALRQLRPFISDNASRPWALCVRAYNDTLYATNNVVAIAAPEIDLDGIDALIPYWAVDFILARDGLTHWSHGEGYVAFHWENSAWMRTQLVADEYPPTIEDIINKAGYATNPMTEEWKKSLEDIAALVEDFVILRADRMTGTNKNMEVVVEAKTIVPEALDYSAWAVKYLQPVASLATHWTPSTYPGPSPFRGDGVVGVIIGRRV